jgi:hypothetical protein
MAAFLRFEKKFSSATLGAVTADREQHIDASANQAIHGER